MVRREDYQKKQSRKKKAPRKRKALDVDSSDSQSVHSFTSSQVEKEEVAQSQRVLRKRNKEVLMDIEE